jgi:hypothetical protein
VVAEVLESNLNDLIIEKCAGAILGADSVTFFGQNNQTLAGGFEDETKLLAIWPL